MFVRGRPGLKEPSALAAVSRAARAVLAMVWSADDDVLMDRGNVRPGLVD